MKCADKAYDSEKVRQQIKDEGALPVIPNRSTAIRKAYCPKRFYRRRHKIENFFCRIKDWRRIATRISSTTWLSWTCPPVTLKLSGRPLLSTIAWIFVVRPPRLMPIA